MSAPSGRAQPAAEWVRVTVRASSGVSGGRSPTSALGQHGLSRSGRPDHQEVVAARRRDLDGPATDGLATDVRHVRRGRRAAGRRRGGSGGPVRPAAQDGDELTERRRAPHGRPADQRSLPDITERDHEPGGGGAIGEGDHARNMTQRPVQPELPAEREAVGAGGAQLAGGDEQAHRDREVEAGATLAHPGGGQVDDRLSKRPRQSAGQKGGAHPIPRLAHRCVGQSDDGEPGQAVGDVDLNRDPAARGSGQSG